MLAAATVTRATGAPVRSRPIVAPAAVLLVEWPAAAPLTGVPRPRTAAMVLPESVPTSHLSTDCGGSEGL